MDSLFQAESVIRFLFEGEAPEVVAVQQLLADRKWFGRDKILAYAVQTDLVNAETKGNQIGAFFTTSKDWKIWIRDSISLWIGVKVLKRLLSEPKKRISQFAVNPYKSTTIVEPKKKGNIKQYKIVNNALGPTENFSGKRGGYKGSRGQAPQRGSQRGTQGGRGRGRGTYRGNSKKEYGPSKKEESNY